MVNNINKLLNYNKITLNCSNLYILGPVIPNVVAAGAVCGAGGGAGGGYVL